MEIYAWIDSSIASVGFHCDGCGKCCHFVEFGHQLWLTNVELALLLRDVPSWDKMGCPWLRGHECTAREARGIGCRTFFCQDHQGDLAKLHEQALEKLRKAAVQIGFELEYDELVASLESGRRKR